MLCRICTTRNCEQCSSRRKYYYNRETAESQFWFDPRIASAEAPEAEKAAPKADADGVEAGVDAGQLAADAESAAEPKLATTQEGAAGDTDSGDDWIELVDSGSGKTYFWNKTTGVTRWDDPRPAKPARRVAHNPLSANASQALSARKNNFTDALSLF
jgi:hypothetical protein